MVFCCVLVVFSWFWWFSLDLGAFSLFSTDFLGFSRFSLFFSVFS